MFRSLRGRLLASYALVILICLTVLGAATWLLLLQRSLPDRQVYQELSVKSQLVLLRPVAEEWLLGQSPQRTELALQRVADAIRARILLAQPDGRVIADSQGGLVDHDLFQEARVSERTATTLRGSFRPAGTLQRWLFVGRVLDASTSPDGRWLIVSQQAPRLPVFQLLGENLASPLVQAALLGFVLSILLASLISRWVARPVQRAAVAARSMAAGNYDQQLPPGGPAEVQELARSFNQMAQKVKKSQQAQRDLVANVSHDLKTPLTSIQGFSQAILDGTAGDPAEAQRAARVIHDEAGRMRRMVDDLLLLARMDAGQLEMNWQPLDLAQLLQSCLARFELRAREAGVSLNLTLPAAGLPALTGDGDRLAQLFGNLLDNALKHTPAAGRVAVSAQAADGHVVVSVADTGPGIPADELPRIFERFFQVDKSRVRSAGEGVGLGLAICKELAEAHHGHIAAESVLEVGSRFSVTLPTAEAAPTVVRKRRTQAG